MTADLSRLAASPAGAADPGATAIAEADGDRIVERISFAQLDALVDGFAAATAGRLPAGGRVAIAAENGIFAAAATLGAMRGGATAVPLNLRLPDDRLAATVADSGAAFAFAPPGVAVRLSIPAVAGPGAGPARAAPRDPALLMYTSGSTGEPKGVPIAHAAYRWALDQFAGLRDTMAGRVGLVAAPLFHMNGQFHLWNLLSVGASVVLMRRFEAGAMLRLVEREGVARITGVPTMMALAVEALETGAAIDTAGVRSIAMGSAPFAPALVERIARAFPNALVTNGYGTTETGPVSFGPSPDGRPTPRGALGWPMPGVRWRLVDGPSPDEGLLELSNPMTLAGYWNRPEATAARLADGWYRTGDRMRRDPQGCFWFAGRSDDMLVVGGENVHPADVEAALQSHPAVAQVAVVGAPHRTKDRAPVAFVVLNAGARAEEAELKAHALARLPAYAHPRRVAVLPALPLMAAAKIDRRRLEGLAVERFGELG